MFGGAAQMRQGRQRFAYLHVAAARGVVCAANARPAGGERLSPRMDAHRKSVKLVS